MSTADESRSTQRPAESGFRSALGPSSLAPLWERIAELLPATPRVDALPQLWDYDALRPLLLQSADVIGADEAERRVLILENRGLAGRSAVTDSLFAGLQVIMPGEVAPEHRHSPAALRFILESDAAYTTVDGERIDMHDGDLILTPSWTWHGHGHDGREPAVWLDVLDLPAVRSLGPRFAERERDASGGHPARARADAAKTLRYPYRDALARLEDLARRHTIDPTHGYRREFLSNVSGGPIMPTIAAFLQLLPAGFGSTFRRTTESLVFCVAEGSGEVVVGTGDDARGFDYKARDIFVVPCWHPFRLAAARRSVLFSASDRPAQTALGLWREESAQPG